MIKLRTLVHPIVTNSAHVISSTKVLMPRWYRGYAVGGIEYAVISTGWQKAAKMVKSCCAVGCTNHYSKGTQIHFYRFPADTQKRALWVAAVRRKNWTPTRIHGYVAPASFMARRTMTHSPRIMFPLPIPRVP